MWMQGPMKRMFDRTKQADVAFSASAQGIGRKGNEGSLQQESSSSLGKQGLELAVPGHSAVQNRQGYCNCCHVHYNNLEQHVYSSQHRHFATYCRNRMGTTSLMERFLEDVLQHHPYRYYDNRPTYDDMPDSGPQLLPRDESLLPVEVMEKGRTARSGEEPSTDSGFIAESGCLLSQRLHEELEKASMTVASIQKLEQQEHSLGTSQQMVDFLSITTPPVPAESALIESSGPKALFAAVNLLAHPLPVSHSAPMPHPLAKHSLKQDLASDNMCEQTQQGICNQDELLDPKAAPVLHSAKSRTVSLSHKSAVSNQGNSLISGQLFLKQDCLQPQDETRISDFCLRNTSNLVGTSSSLAFPTTSQLSGKNENKSDRITENSVDEIIEEVILKYCYETPPKELTCPDEDTNSCINILPLLGQSSVHGSDISFDCDAAVQPGALLPEAAVKNLELLKEVQINLQDENYDTQLSSILQNGFVQQVADADKDVSAHNQEPVLPALPHVPPSFVGKTWTQIMYEDDMKIEALVRDFREGRFRCHFDTESSANCARNRLRKKKQKNEDRISAAAAHKAEVASAKGLPESTDVLSDGSDFNNPHEIPETQHMPETWRRPQKRTWRLASRCQVVKVSHGTQTSLVHYPVVKQKIIRKDRELPNQKASLVWSESEKTPSMKTRLCALKLPASYTKIMSPLQPQTVVYVLSCPELKQFRSKPEDIPKMRRSHSSTDSKDSIRYKYRQNSIKYYDPLTNRVLKTPPKSIVGEKAQKPPHVRQLFRSLNLDANGKKQADVLYECIAPKPLNSPDFHGLSASFMLDLVKKNDMSALHKTDGSSISTERSECLVCNSSETSYKHVVFSPLNSQQSQWEGDFQLAPFKKKEVKPPLKSGVSQCLERDNPKTVWHRKKGNSREPGISRKSLGSAFVRIRRSGRKQLPRTTTQQKEGLVRKMSTRHQKKTTTAGKHLKKEKLNAQKLKVARKSKRTVLDTAAIMATPEKRKRTTARD
ncbi:DBF4-type zinc finger-containing protein 2 isoform X1 [Varanus komodoensis]|uniref:DBF4-type zinc finger-containing protein 2 isoform X1 n=2 Tax=Varanus komodoensis TaxID=61221 RepID=UPI001CF78ED6|nr:DBF4-type zinc finger-containing protein 2 isoform X1 [Varanus komodoensis]XP_044288027.1 DBF4-type zinc finger-containing protein 2 isoform X1 [Varanus komodoensis]XP_044288028.1 DBF4-type zinc finger-containing protein 2 isoform X1 [Varanus komodoensis]XP_044288029.1 DBF4-type zinc finger-containing protein 2 isoform X1 [Varanus komodoensis]XP_044288030.1 DBF4-type zinc finger-containing protein 2 isoform X1 [Varanus komodoensis]XP_044288031.1 DBF4-type zinc finger-containing protein 2 is